MRRRLTGPHPVAVRGLSVCNPRNPNALIFSLVGSTALGTTDDQNALFGASLPGQVAGFTLTRLHAYTNRQVGLILESGKGRTGEGLGSHYHGGLYACWPNLQAGLGWAPLNNAMSLAGGYMTVTSHPPWISPTMLNTRPEEVLGSMLFT
ncbi:uncharacterized protein BO95DRAFT_516323 [Aspergillus brunneoviolaceus CBS 621.78]|uniref:Uncharacterized protein n=1 Tax=Aspergillus brunneoviolaceus CBS 621.78 TaxID=1450534 RepID=A0ACD1G2F7_9EURO|nr:hypothetical protein BO95DRAFT_516323 [Aspergillus brunneoviolaceus CBS 621.78]RAH43454.1 hypothetical protein BO95DRAFT_516323 [Aspergillus brunneoviolaceus CBS 621.78]